ncbi:hypothetical protein [Nocardioides houyundeii]|nr:hypothetical protein [Nocardioides houyundeii]
MSSPLEDPDRVDPTKSSGRPLIITAMLGVGVLVMLAIGIFVL